MWKPLLAAVGGAAIGFWVAKLRYEKAAYAYATERIEEAKAFAEARADREIQEFKAEASTEFSDKLEGLEEELLEEVAAGFSDPAISGIIQNYQGFSTPAPSTTAEEDSESHIRLMRRKEFFEYDDEVGEYHKVAVTYYQNDDILYEDLGQKQLDVQAAVGNIRPSWFGHEADDENVCYVENSKSKIMFEVIRSQGSFAQDVLGLSDDEDKAE